MAFEFLCLSHTFLSYIAALGAHRDQIHDQDTLKLLDQALDDIQGALLHDQRPELSIINMQQLIRKRMNQTEELASKELIVLQQLQLIFSILQQLSGLKQNLSHERDDQSTELASI